MFSLPKAWVQFLVREPGFHKLCGTAEKEESKFCTCLLLGLRFMAESGEVYSLEKPRAVPGRRRNRDSRSCCSQSQALPGPGHG